MVFQMLATAWVIQTDIVAYWQYNLGGGCYRYGLESSAHRATFLCHVIQGGKATHGHSTVSIPSGARVCNFA